MRVRLLYHFPEISYFVDPYAERSGLSYDYTQIDLSSYGATLEKIRYRTERTLGPNVEHVQWEDDIDNEKIEYQAYICSRPTEAIEEFLGRGNLSESIDFSGLDETHPNRWDRWLVVKEYLRPFWVIEFNTLDELMGFAEEHAVVGTFTFDSADPFGYIDIDLYIDKDEYND